MARTFEVKTRLTAEDDASATIKGVDESLDGLSTRSTKVTAALGVAAVALGALAVAAKAGISAANEQEDALNRLDSALKLTGTEGFTAALRDQAKALQETTRFSDDSITSAQALIATYGVAGDQLALATQAAADLAARLGIDLSSAAQQVAATTNGVTGGLAKLVPELKGLSAESLRAGDGIVVLANAMRGGAVEAADTMTGSLDRLSNAFTELITNVSRWGTEAGFVRRNLDLVTGGVLLLNDAFGKGEGFVEDYGNSFANLVKQQEAAARTITKLADVQDRATRIMSEFATGQQRAAQIAAELGIVLERDVIAKREREAELYQELADLERQGIDVRQAATDSIESQGEAIDGVNVSRQIGIGLIQNEIAAQAALAQRVTFTAQAYDYLARTQGRGAANEAAIAAGGRTILGGTRLLLPGGGSRLTSTPGFGRFGDG